jgi:hypothetical protein
MNTIEEALTATLGGIAVTVAALASGDFECERCRARLAIVAQQLCGLAELLSANCEDLEFEEQEDAGAE